MHQRRPPRRLALLRACGRVSGWCIAMGKVAAEWDSLEFFSGTPNLLGGLAIDARSQRVC